MVGERIARVLIEQGGEFEHGEYVAGPPGGWRAPANLDLIERQEPGSGCATTPPLPGRAARGAGRASDGGRGAELRTDGRHPLQRRCAKPSSPKSPSAWCAAGTASITASSCARGDRMIIAPPLITRAQVDEMMVLMRKALDRTYAEVSARPGGCTARRTFPHENCTLGLRPVRENPLDLYWKARHFVVAPLPRSALHRQLPRRRVHPPARPSASPAKWQTNPEVRRDRSRHPPALRRPTRANTRRHPHR